MIVFSLYHGIINITYASSNTGNPNVTVTINPNGQVGSEGNLFGEGFWYPGKSETGVIRIYNNFGPINVNDLRLKVTLDKIKEGESWDRVYNSFVRNMKLTLQKGKLFVFNETLLEDASLESMLQSNGNQGEGSLANFKIFSLIKGDTFDVNYTLHMDEAAENELESLSATISVLLDVGGSKEDEGTPGGGNNSDNGNGPIPGGGSSVEEVPEPGVQPGLEQGVPAEPQQEEIVELEPEIPVVPEGGKAPVHKPSAEIPDLPFTGGSDMAAWAAGLGGILILGGSVLMRRK